MKQEFSNTAPVHVVFAVASLFATPSIGGLIDILTLRYTGLLDTQHRQTMIVKTGAANSIEESAGIGGSNETQC